MQLRYFIALCGLVIAIAAAIPYPTPPTPSPPSTPEFDFAISVSPSEIECLSRFDVVNGMVTVSAQSINSTQPVSLTLSGLPGATVYSFEPETGVPPFTSKLRIEPRYSGWEPTPVSIYILVITGSGGGRTHSTTLTLTIKLAAESA